MTLSVRTILVGGLALVAGGAIAVVASAHVDRSPTSLGATMAPSESYVYGAVTSERKACEDRRKVKLYRKRDGADRLIGTSRAIYSDASATGPYTITSETARFPDGRYYSRAKATTLESSSSHEHVCGGGTSTTVTSGP